jgi:predicted DNA-binding transcriptional regulator AlpA
MDEEIKSKRARANSKLSNTMRSKGYVLCAEVAKLIGVDRTTVYRWVKADKIKAISFNGAHFVEWASVIAFMGDAAGVLSLDMKSKVPVVVQPPVRIGRLAALPGRVQNG